MQKYISFLAVLTLLTFGFTPLVKAADATPETTATATASPTTTPEVTASASPTPEATPKFNFTTRSIVLTKFRRFFTWNTRKRAELTVAITNALIAKAQEQQAAGETEKAASTLDKFETENGYLQTVVNILAENTTDQSVIDFLDTVMLDKTTQLTALDEINPEAASELAKKITATRAKALVSIVRILEKPNLSDEDREKKLSKVIDQYARKESKIDTKILRKLALKEEIDDQTTDPKLEDDLDKTENDILDTSSELETADADNLVDTLNTEAGDDDPKIDHLMGVLQKLLTRVPDAAKPKVQAAFTALIERKASKLEEHPEKVEEVLKDNSATGTDREKILKQLKDKVKSTEAQNNLKREIEKQGATETQRSSGSGSSTATPKPSSTSTATPTATPAKEVGITIRIKDGNFEKTSFTVDKGSKLTIRFENEDSASHSLSISNGATSSAIGQDERATLSAFIIDSNLTFSSVINGATKTGTISVQ